jgi:transcriptional regulator with XRE-family HTH domain
MIERERKYVARGEEHYNAKLTRHDVAAQNFGEFFKARRRGLRKTLREFCRENEFDPGNLSKLERSILPPPQSREILERYAHCLEIVDGSPEWYTFFDLAAAENGRIPADLNESDLAKKLPPQSA